MGEWLLSRWDGAIFLMIQALRAWLISRYPSGTKAYLEISGMRVKTGLGES
jgi:hypothetical protein